MWDLSSNGSTERDYKSGRPPRTVLNKEFVTSREHKRRVYQSSLRPCPYCGEYMGNISVDIASRLPGTCTETECAPELADANAWDSVEVRWERFRDKCHAYWHEDNERKIMRASTWGSRQPVRVLTNAIQNTRPSISTSYHTPMTNIIWLPNDSLTGQNFINTVRDRQDPDRKDRMRRSIQWAAEQNPTAGKKSRRHKKGALKWSPSAGQL